METPPAKESDGHPPKRRRSEKTPPIPTPPNPRRQSSGHHFTADTQPVTQTSPQPGHSRSQVTYFLSLPQLCVHRHFKKHCAGFITARIRRMGKVMF